jgi:predicted small lipoprotein YifL
MSRPASLTNGRYRGALAARIVVVLLVAVMLAGCGKKGNPLPPPGEKNEYPKPYPKE